MRIQKRSKASQISSRRCYQQQMNRIQKLQEKLGSSFEAALVEETANRWYLSEFRSSAGILIITEDEALFIVDFRYIEIAKRLVFGAKVVLQEIDYIGQIKDFLTTKGIKNIQVEDEMTLSQYNKLSKEIPEVKFVSGTGLSRTIHELRAQKEAKEIDAIKKAQDITEKAFEHILTFIKPGLTEREVATELEC
ncbi:MAG: aminopeptidase P family N-terminal domain-containing protein [Oscillospiraceae bacterium]|nr:aminopeptidase P family N-terminal domain-containing protein [Oscillospiraceae bacterium]